MINRANAVLLMWFYMFVGMVKVSVLLHPHSVQVKFDLAEVARRHLWERGVHSIIFCSLSYVYL